MFNQDGEIVGLNTYIFTGAEDLTFAKPIDLQLETIRTIWERGEIVRGSMGFSVKGFPLIDRKLADFPEELTGALVSTVEANSPAAVAGLVKNDIVTKMAAYDANGRVIKSMAVDIDDVYEGGGIIRRWAATLPPGATVNMTVYRKVNGQYAPIELKIGVGKLEEKVEVAAASWGLTVSDAGDGDMVISEIDPESPAGKAGLTPGRYYLVGVDSDTIPKKLRPFAQNMHSIEKLDELFELLEDRMAEEIVITIADIENPAKTRRLRLKRPLE
jgi:S1-C subfamily serine protease